MAGWRDFTIPLYPGNYVAHKLKAMHDDSKSVFPESVYSTKTQANNRWTSMTKADYIPFQEIRRKAQADYIPLEEIRRKARITEKIRRKARITEKLNENKVSVKLG